MFLLPFSLCKNVFFRFAHLLLLSIFLLFSSLSSLRTCRALPELSEAESSSCLRCFPLPLPSAHRTFAASETEKKQICFLYQYYVANVVATSMVFFLPLATLDFFFGLAKIPTIEILRYLLLEIKDLFCILFALSLAF